jgi:hypothetical protein
MGKGLMGRMGVLMKTTTLFKVQMALTELVNLGQSDDQLFLTALHWKEEQRAKQEVLGMGEGEGEGIILLTHQLNAVVMGMAQTQEEGVVEGIVEQTQEVLEGEMLNQATTTTIQEAMVILGGGMVETEQMFKISITEEGVEEGIWEVVEVEVEAVQQTA